MKQRKVPLRKCTGCQDMKEKKGLIRVVRTEKGEYFLDFTGKASGRGAYICPDMECLLKAEKTKGLERSFKSQVPGEVYSQLEEELVKRLGKKDI